MDWWNGIQAWFVSATGSKIFLDAILPFVAIVLAGIIAAGIGRGSARRVIDHEDREHTAAAVIALIVVGRKAAIWSSLGGDEKQHVDSLMSEADIRVRLLPVSGSSVAADWAAHELATMKKTSASFSFQAEQSFVDYRDRLLSWQAKPRRARKLFASDLDQWKYEDAGESPLVAEQQKWATEHVQPTPTAPGAAAPTAVLPTTPGLATAAPPTTTAMDAPPPETPTQAAVARSKNAPTTEAPA
jgi:cell division septation protein DedD